MFDILLISDQPRLHTILNSVGRLPGCTLRICTSLNQGLKEISANCPSLLFLQNRLSGLSGSILVKHVRSESGSTATRIILFTDSSSESGESTADIELPVSVPDAELSDAITEIIGDQLGGITGKDTAGAKSPASAAQPDYIPPPGVEAQDDTVSFSTAATRAQPRSTLLELSHTGKAGNAPREDTLPRQATILSSSPPPIQWEKKRVTIALLAIGLIFIASMVIVFMTGTFTSQKSQPAVPQPKPQSPALQKQATSHPAIARSNAPLPPLPSFIPVDGHDPAYATTNPGWERYSSAAHEFKMYHEAGSVKALQVIDRQATGISPAFFSKVLREMAKVRDYRLESRETKGEFLVKKGKLSPSAQVIIYKNKADTQLHAFVIHFDKDNSAAKSGKGPE